MSRRSPPSRLIWSAAVLCATALVPGCIITTGSHVHRTGKDVGRETLAQIEPGRKKDFVLALLGEPTSKTEVEGGTEIWKWAYSERRVHHGSVLLVIETGQTQERTGASYVQFQDGSVAKAWQD